MDKSAIIIITLILVVIGFFVIISPDEPTGNTDTSLEVPTPGFEDADEMIVGNNGDETEDDETITTPQSYIVEFTNSGYEPSTLEINVGDTVTFTNTISTKTWPATNNHPTHTIYPGSSIGKCGTSTEIFDACKSLEKDESYSFTFNEVGSWKYHDHRSTSTRGTIIVS